MIMKKILSWLRNKRVSNEPAGIQYFIRTEKTYTSREDAELAMAMLREGKIPLKKFKIVEQWNVKAVEELSGKSQDTLSLKPKQM